MSDRGRGLFLVAAFTFLASAPWWGKAYHNDEPFFLAAGRHILQDPLHPLDFDFTWYGRPLPAAQINTTPPVLLYALALALKLTGGGEFAMRLALFPFDLAAALALYLLAARFLKRPLLPVLIVIASPAYLINMGHLMAEKPMAAFSLWSLYALLRGLEEPQSRWYHASALLAGAALVSKYAAVSLLLPALVLSLRSGLKPRRIAGYGVLALAPLALLLLHNLAFNPEVLERAWSVTRDSSASWWSSWPHKLRSVLAFTGGCGVVTLAWPLLLAPGRRRAGLAAAGALALAALLFLPALDLAPVVRGVDRITGAVFAVGALLSLALFAGPEARGLKGWPLWVSWGLGVLLLQVFLYWSVMARIILFLVPPLVLGMAELLEKRRGVARLGRVYAPSLLAAVLLSFSLSWVDLSYAAAQKDFARQVAEKYLAAGRRVWFTGYMGLQHYVEAAGARGLDAGRGGWDLARPGDVVLVLKINSTLLRPRKPVRADAHRFRIGHPIPLRLISGWTGEGGFYANLNGFLPFSLSWEPLEEFEIVELL